MIKRFNRYEIKYAVPVRHLAALKSDLDRFLQRDANASRGGFYSVASLYLDTPDLDCYRHKLDGLLFRRKLRIRVYPDRPDGPAFVEIKQRINRTVQKRRLPMDLADAYTLCSGAEVALRDSSDDQSVVDEVHYLVRSLRLRPKNVISYTRQAFVGHFVDPGLRITFDTLIRTRAAGFDLTEPRKMMLAFPANMAVMEIKANERVPHWLTSMMARHECTLTRISKYCNGITSLAGRLALARTIVGGGGG